MYTKKLTSIRLDEDTLEKIEKFAKDRDYWKRSDVINNILRAVFENFGDRQIYDMVCIYRWKQNIVDTKFEITKEMKPFKPL